MTQFPFKEGALGGTGIFQTVQISKGSVLERQSGEMVLVILIWSSLEHLTDRPSCIGEGPTWAQSVSRPTQESRSDASGASENPPRTGKRHVSHSSPGSFPHLFRCALNYTSIHSLAW